MYNQNETIQKSKEKMKQLVLFLFALCFQTTMMAQSYTDHLQKVEQGKGTITIHQNKEIDDLVNGKIQVVPQKQNTPKANNNTNNTKQKTDNTDTKKTTATDNSQNLTNQNGSEKTEEEKQEELAQKEREEQIRREKEELARKIAEQRLQEAEENGESSFDNSKKVMRQSYKINGYRVQAYLGGNSRADREKAQQIGNAIKRKYPLEPIYVHFYSPRWTCRVGNYRTYEDAKKMLDNIKKMGYKEATILKGKITVQY